jgi:hypothetical protein
MITTSRKAFQGKITGLKRWGARHFTGQWTGASSATCARALTIGPSFGNKGTVRNDIVKWDILSGGAADVFPILCRSSTGALNMLAARRMRLSGICQHNLEAAALWRPAA